MASEGGTTETDVSASAVTSTASEKCTSWVRQFFDTKEVPVTNKKTGESLLVLSDVCNLLVDGSKDKMCGAVYKRNLNNGTKTMQRHLLNKHRENPSIAREIVNRNLDCLNVSF
jgi:hypothetical protein